MQKVTRSASVLVLSAALLFPINAVAQETALVDQTIATTELSIVKIDLDAFYGRLEPLNGDLDPFFGKIDPFYGSIDPLFGSIDPFFGKIDPFYGKIDPFWGGVNPFWGGINPFYGKISPFWGDIDPFWGGINPFFGNIDTFWGDLDPFWGGINPFFGDIGVFWGDIGPFWGDVSSFWGNLDPFSTDTQGDYDQVIVMLQGLVAQSEAVWGGAVLDATGLSFSNGFADAVFEKYGIDLNDSSSIANLDASDRSLFFLDWYDGLMNFSGIDHVDHWMPLINWSPRLTQIQGGGSDVVVGLLDVKISTGSTVGNSVTFVGGYDYSVNSHGVGVVGLIAGAHDGQGVMGIAPNANLLNYNPFDETGTAGWGDVIDGIMALRLAGASVVNMSLGQPGWVMSDGWGAVFSNSNIASLTDTVLVKAAGNEGIVQTAGLDWSVAYKTDNLILVGSVGPTGEISYFSNSPGEACFIHNSECLEENKLKYHFLVAPGELILVADENGDLSRVSGTSFAAPLVTGAIALLQDRWPWMQDYSSETVDVILQSAQDLGEPGVDAIYGWGLLDVEASQSPLSFDDLRVYMPDWESGSFDEGSNLSKWSSKFLKEALLAPGALSLFEDLGVFIYATENIGSTYRDFAIPLSTTLNDQTVWDINGNALTAQTYLYKRLIDWSNGTGFTDMEHYSVPLFAVNGLSFEMTAMPLQMEERSDRQDTTPFRTELGVRHKATGFEFHMGVGTGATALYHQDGFGFNSDYDIAVGGVNPMLGFASGGGYASASLDVLQGTSLTLGFTNKDDDHITQDGVTGYEVNTLEGFENYKASAYAIGFESDVSEKASVSVSYVLLNEETGLLGSQGKGALSLGGGAATDSLTLGMTTYPTHDITLSVSATAGNTRGTKFDNSVLQVADNGLQSTAFALSVHKQGLFGQDDGLRVTLMQPLHIESGDLKYGSVQVIDRQTGELGVVTETWNLGASDRQFVTEFMYVTPVLRDRLELSLFGQAKFNDSQSDVDNSELMFGFGLGHNF